MANFICEFEGARGRNLKLYDTKIIITTKKTVGSFITGNFTDGEKTIFLCDVVGVQFKKSGIMIGYLQFETPSLQMNNKSDNMFSENTFTYENGKNGITNELIEAIYNFVTDRIEELKYGTNIIKDVPDFEAMKEYKQPQNDENTAEQEAEERERLEAEKIAEQEAEERAKLEAEEKAEQEAMEKERREVERFLDGLPYMPKPIDFEINARWEKSIKKLPYEKLRLRYLDIGNYSDNYRYTCYLEIINRNKQ